MSRPVIGNQSDVYTLAHFALAQLNVWGHVRAVIKLSPFRFICFFGFLHCLALAIAFSLLLGAVHTPGPGHST